MSISLFSCPTPAAIPSHTNQECLAEFGTVIALAVQLTQATPSFTGTGTGDIKLLASWTPLLSATGDTKIVIIPIINFTATPGESITSGGNDATTYGGVPKVLHGGFTQITALLEGYLPEKAKEVRDLTKFSRVAGGRTRLRVFELTNKNYIAHKSDFQGMEAYTWFVSDRIKGTAWMEPDNYNLAYTHEYGYSESLDYSLASFDLASLQNG